MADTIPPLRKNTEKVSSMNMKKCRQLLIASTLISASAMASADSFSYNFLSASISSFSSEIDGVDDDLEGSGIQLSFSHSLDDKLALIGGYGSASSDIYYEGYTFDIETDVINFGGLYHLTLNDRTDFFAGVKLVKGSVDMNYEGENLASENVSGNTIFAGVRNMANEQLELNGSFNRSTLEDDTNNIVAIGASYYVNTDFSLDAGYSFDSDTSAIAFGATKRF